MAKNITIAEDGVSRNFTAKKLKTNLQGGGNCTWIPEDEAADYCTFKELKVTANGTYKASDKNCDGFDKVKVEISADVLPQKTITTNGEYDAMQDDGRVGYAHVTVNVPGGGGGPFTVLFLDDEGNVLKKQENVPYGGYASCTALDGTILNGLYFKGWNPVPKNVQFNMTCRPVRGDYVITPGEIQDDWETIVADGGAHYPLGAYKPLVIEIPATVYDATTRKVSQVYYNGSRYDFGRDLDTAVGAIRIACHMVKVAEGEDGTTSTWMSDNVVDFFIPNVLPRANALTYREVMKADGVGQMTVNGLDWATCAARQYLNNEMFNALPPVLQAAIKEVNKTYKATNISPQTGAVAGMQLVDKTSIDLLWIPSMAEMKTMYQGASNYETAGSAGRLYKEAMELEGIDYTAVFRPLFSVPFFTRGVWADGGGSYAPGIISLNPNNQINYENARGNAFFGFCL